MDSGTTADFNRKTSDGNECSRDLHIAYGSSSHALKWSNKTIGFEDLEERLSNTIRTPESIEEYLRMSRTERDGVKDKGGFVAGELSGGLRRINTVETRSMITLDGDHADKDFVDGFEDRVPYRSCMYTTHSNTEDSPRIRVIIPLTRDVSAEEFVAVSRYVAQELGIEMFDECSYRPNQLMYWPSTPSNGIFIFKRSEKDWLDPDSILSAHPEWTDPTRLPTSSRESKANSVQHSKVQDPLEKKGVIGLFNRAYFPISSAIDMFLSDIYEPTEIPGRYHLIESRSMPGVTVIDDRFVYSHHAKDPAYGKLCNAFDLVRIHLFGDDGDKTSLSRMCEFAMQQDEVKVLAARDRLALASDDFSQYEDEWMKRLQYKGKSTQLENNVWNLNLILENDPDFSGFAFNEMAGRVQITGSVPWDRPEGNMFWRDADTSQLKSLIDTRYLAFSTRNYDISFTKVSDDRHFHPIRDYLDALPDWDGKIRVPTLFIDYMDAEDSEYNREVTRKTFVGAVARIYRPGIKFDSIPVIDGVQGIGKSSIVRDLIGSDYYSDTLSLTDMSDKSGAEKLQGFWAVEIGELAGMKKADIECVKAFLSCSDDKYRPSYGRCVESHPRQCIIIATVNGERGYLRDITGNRRFWIIKVHQTEQRQKWSFTRSFRDQFWAEAKHYFEQGEKLYLEGPMIAEAEKLQKGAMEVDERQGMVERYLNTLLPDNWDDMDQYARREFLNGDPLSRTGTERRTTVSNAEIWCECFGKSLSELKPSDSYSISALMEQIPGWERTQERKTTRIYGRQRIYTRR